MYQSSQAQNGVFNFKDFNINPKIECYKACKGCASEKSVVYVLFSAEPIKVRINPNSKAIESEEKIETQDKEIKAAFEEETDEPEQEDDKPLPTDNPLLASLLKAKGKPIREIPQEEIPTTQIKESNDKGTKPSAPETDVVRIIADRRRGGDRRTTTERRKGVERRVKQKRKISGGEKRSGQERRKGIEKRELGI